MKQSVSKDESQIN